jgi:mannose-6-phosphate isomerase-like protein (cupin superfamily)
MNMNELEIIQHQQIDGLSIFLNTVDYRTPHLHSEWEMIWVLENPLSVTCGPKQYVVEPGQMILFNPGEPHEFHKTGAGCTFACLQISSQILPISSRLYADACFPHEHLSPKEMSLL